MQWTALMLLAIGGTALMLFPIRWTALMLLATGRTALMLFAIKWIGLMLFATDRGLRACAHWQLSTALGVKHFIAEFGLTFTSTCLG
jgi:hypothetical protein